MNLEKEKLADLLEEVSRRGFISTKRELNVDRTYKFPRRLKPFKIGVISDTHFGSVQQQISLTHSAYEIFSEEGVSMVLHCGDIFEGWKMHKDQLYEVFLVGGDKAINYAIKNYPKIEGIKTHIIMGNHDASIFNDVGIDPVAALCDKRDDLNYLGAFNATIEIGKIKIQLMHPDGGNAYARSYKMQKIIEQMSSSKKPNILLMGHFHTASILPQYRNVYGIQLPCMQDQTAYLKRKGLNPDIGIVILDITPDTKGIAKLKVEYIPFYEPLAGDY